jgi:hypothetical protein
VKNSSMNIAVTLFVFEAHLLGADDQDVIDPSGYQKLCENLGVDISGVCSYLTALTYRYCR